MPQEFLPKSRFSCSLEHVKQSQVICLNTEFIKLFCVLEIGFWQTWAVLHL